MCAFFTSSNISTCIKSTLLEKLAFSSLVFSSVFSTTVPPYTELKEEDSAFLNELESNFLDEDLDSFPESEQENELKVKIQKVKF